MAQLLEDLAEETSASNRRLADRFDEEARELEEMQRAAAALEDLRQTVVLSARQATDYVLSRLPQAEGLWQSTMVALRTRRDVEYEKRLLRALIDAGESSHRLAQKPRVLWQIATALGALPERLDELERAERWFGDMAAEARSALEHRTRGWQPADPDRLARGLQQAAEGQTIKARDAAARFRRP